MFEKAGFNELMLFSHRDREVIILRDKDKSDIDYCETEETQSQRLVVQEYNKLLERTFIDIGEVEIPVLTFEKKAGSKDLDKPHRVHITHKSKFTRRIFNNGSFTESGRVLWWLLATHR